MKTPAVLFAWFALTLLPLLGGQKPDAGQVFEMRTYFAAEGKLEALQARFRDHTVNLFEKHGMTNVGYWVPADSTDQRLIYLLAYPSREARESSWKAFLSDPAWKAAKAASEKDGNLVAKVDAVFLTLTDYSPAPKISVQQPSRQFELRTYLTRDGKLPNLDARFRDHTVGLFEKHGMTNVAYFHLMDDQKNSANTLVYFLAHRDDAARQESFGGFRQDPAWQAARQASEAAGPLLTEGGVQSVPLVPVDFSPMK